MVSAIPEKVTMEAYIRGKTYDAILSANKKINQALCGAALSLGVNVEIKDIPGYAPHVNDVGLTKIAEESFKELFPERELLLTGAHTTGSTDLGDLSCIMPVVHPYMGGAKGKAHGNDYEIFDPESACVDSAKWQVAMLTSLLEKAGERAKKIVEEYQPMFSSKEEFLSFQDSLNTSGDRIVYRQDGVVEVKC